MARATGEQDVTGQQQQGKSLEVGAAVIVTPQYMQCWLWWRPDMPDMGEGGCTPLEEDPIANAWLSY